MSIQLIIYVLISSHAVVPNMFVQGMHEKIITVNNNGTDLARCCTEGECNCSSLYEALQSLNDNTNIRIMSKFITLNSVVEIRNVKNIKITGSNNSIIMCSSRGGLSCDSCSNVFIEYVVWDRCGSTERLGDLPGGVYFSNVRVITITNSTFQHSVVHGLAISSPTGRITILNSNFSFNHILSNCSTTHGGGVLVTSEPESYSKQILVEILITGSFFSHNGYSGDDYSCNINGSGLHIDIGGKMMTLSLIVNHCVFEFNKANRGGGIYLNAIASSFSDLVFSDTNFTHNFGGGVWMYTNSISNTSLNFTSLHFHNNSGNHSGAVGIHCKLDGLSSTYYFALEKSLFSSNNATSVFGAMYLSASTENPSFVSVKDSQFVNNYGLDMHMEIASNQSIVIFSDVIYIGNKSSWVSTFVKANKYCFFDLNRLYVSGYISNGSFSVFKITSPDNYDVQLSNSSFTDNTCFGEGNVLHFDYHYYVGYSIYTVNLTNCTFNRNIVKSDGGGVVYIENKNKTPPPSPITVKSSKFSNNEGSTMYVSFCTLTLSGSLLFHKNKANSGAALYFVGSQTQWINGNITFSENFAKLRGGAIYVAVLSPCTYVHGIFFSVVLNTMVNFSGNTAQLSGNSMYFSLAPQCGYITNISSNLSLLYYPKIFSYSEPFRKEVTTTPYSLNFSLPAICQQSNMYDSCSFGDIMLGEEIVIGAQVLDYFGSVTDSMQFLVSCGRNCVDYKNEGSNPVLVHNDSFRGVKIAGSKVSQSSNVTLVISSIVSSDIPLKKITLYLTVNLSACYPGFVYGASDKMCVCYGKNISICVGNKAMVKHGYWIGVWKGRFTATFCPYGYCNFDDCNSNGYCKLSHIQDKQCSHSRAGAACSKCVSGHVLSFDSNYCVHKNSCSAGMTALIIISSLLYWIIMVAVIVLLMHFNFQVGSGYIYGIVYFYSVVDILLEDNLYLSNYGVFRFVTILSSFAKLTPQFLGTICFVDDDEWGGIDQQFFHYIHPVIVILILMLLTLAAKYSLKLSNLIRRGIIRAICLVLLLAYTSVASTSLALLRPLIFQDLDGVYTYASPHKRYFEGRHIFYGCTALICIFIVIGFPLVLIMEPFISYKIDFSRIRPLLDQYQGCFRDNRRVFAAFYLLCRLAILTVVYAENSNYYNRFFMLNVVCIVIAMIHSSVMPYKNSNLNALDGVILLTAVFIVALNLAFSFTTFYCANTEIVIALVIFPLIAFTVFIIKSVLKNAMCKRKGSINDAAYRYYSDSCVHSDDERIRRAQIRRCVE